MKAERFFSIIDQAPPPQKAAHYLGAPPEVTGNTRERVPLPRARIVVMEQDNEGVSLYRYAADGTFGGDTWHPTQDEAREQARFEYGDALGRWHLIPPETGDSIEYALAQLEAS